MKQMAKKTYVINAKGEQEPFSLEKVRRSCIRSGADSRLANKIADEIQAQVYDGMKTADIYKMIKRQLRRHPAASMRFSLKDAMRRLGPHGFSFERYIGDVLRNYGYKVETNRMIAGKCISDYEIDFTAEKNSSIKIGECKYHTFAGSRVDLQVALYNYARYLDIKANPRFKSSRAILVTNTKFSSEAMAYSNCVGVELLGWRYPRDNGLEYMIEKNKLYPVTILPSFRPVYKDIFANNNLMVVSDLLEMPAAKLAGKLNIPVNEVEKLAREAALLLE